MTRYLVTGATGFIGAALTLELLDRTDADITCVVRPQGGSAGERLTAALLKAAAAYDLNHLRQAITSRCHAIPGDIASDRCGVPDIGQVDEMFHAAASLAYQQRHKKELLSSNVEGTANALALGRALGARAFNYLSTAYVVGRRTGLIAASPVPGTDQCDNWYERSKVLAEQQVLAAVFPLVRVFRPTIIIGHSETFATTAFTGLYGFVAGLQTARAQVRRHLGDILVFRPLRILADPDARINFLPIDRAVAAVVGICLADGARGSQIYHIANLCQPTMADCMRVLGASLNIKAPVCVSDPDEFTLLDQRVDRRLEFYRSYVSGTKYFDVTATTKVIGEGILSYELPEDRLLRIVRWYLDNHRAKRA
jgi:nucleoside-diphosphate-sugar epimerase